MNERKGQIQLSFGMIFSIIIIIATLAVSGYVIVKFLGMNDCAKVTTFYTGIQSEVRAAYEAEISQKTFTGQLPSGVTEVCFGNLSTAAGYKKEVDELNWLSKDGDNLFVYPSKSACKGLGSINLKYVYPADFFCTPVKDGKVSLNLRKSATDRLVRVVK